MVKIPRSTTAVGRDADAVTSRTVPGAGTAASGTTGGPAEGETANGPETPAHSETVDAARTAAILDGRPQEASLATEGAAGSALNAPSVGSGAAAEMLDRTFERRDVDQGLRLTDLALDRPAVVGGGPTVAVDLAAGIAPALMSREGAHGSVPEADRRSILAQIDEIAGGPVLRSTGYKRAAPLPKDRVNVAELIAEGFDLIVTSKQDGFRRAGVGHPTAPTLRRSEDFTVDELQEMDADPMLVVQALR